jgi:hypothetical protein
MKKVGVISLILVVAMLPSLSGATEMRLAQSTLAGGIGRPSSQNHRLLCTVGQALAGSASNETYTTQAGCIYQPPQILAGVEDPIAGVSTRYRLAPNFPNPFRTSTAIRFCVPKRSHVSLRVYDVRGREVQAVLDGEVGPGYQTSAFDGSNLASGVYYCRMVAGRFSETRKMVLLK